MRSPVVAGKLSAASLHWSTPARKNETFPFSWLMRATRAGGSLAGTFSWLEGEACAGRHHDGRANSSDTNTTNRQPRSLWDLLLCCIAIREVPAHHDRCGIFSNISRTP